MMFLLVLSKNILCNHIEKQVIIFGRLCSAVLKCNSLKCSFGLKDIPDQGYVTTWEGIKPYTGKVQGVMDTRQPTTTTEARSLISMAQYYRDIWPR